MLMKVIKNLKKGDLISGNGGNTTREVVSLRGNTLAYRCLENNEIRKIKVDVNDKVFMV